MGSIEGVFTHACNLLPAGSDVLITFALPVLGRLPYGIHLAPGSVDDFGALSLSPGQSVYRSGRQLIVPDAQLAFDLRSAADWSAFLAVPAGFRFLSALCRVNLEWAARYLFDQVPLQGVVPLLRVYRELAAGEPWELPAGENELPFIAGQRIRGILKALRAESPVELAHNVASIIGLGIGLTPSCDDLLLGLLAALCGCGSEPKAGRACKLLATSIRRVLRADLTTRVSYTALYYALDQQFSEKLQQALIGFVMCNTFAALETRLKPLLTIGATSGAEMALGLCLGLEWLSRQISVLEG